MFKASCLKTTRNVNPDRFHEKHASLGGGMRWALVLAAGFLLVVSAQADPRDPRPRPAPAKETTAQASDSSRSSALDTVRRELERLRQILRSRLSPGP